MSTNKKPTVIPISQGSTVRTPEETDSLDNLPMDIEPDSVTNADQIERLRNLIKYARETQYAPDIQGIITIASWYVGHWFYSEAPIWIMLLGPSGMGKTTLGIEPLINLEQVELCDVIGEHSFISGFDEVGILQKFTKDHKGNGVLAFSDFSTVVDADERDRKKIFALLRGIYDGRTHKQTGNKGRLEWSGKVSAIAACTNKIERFWSVARDLGERWIVLRWRYGHRDGYMDYAHKHRDHGKEISTEYRRRFHALVTRTGLKNYIPKETRGEQYDKFKPLQELARFACRTRRSVERGGKGWRRDINYVGEEEGPNRLYKALMNIALANAAMMRQTRLSDANINIAARLAIDTIPLQRRQVLAFLSRHFATGLESSLPKYNKLGDNSLSVTELQEGLQMNQLNLELVLEDLAELKLITYLEANETESLNNKDDELTNGTVAINPKVVTDVIRRYLNSMPLRILDAQSNENKDLVTEDE